MISMMNDLFLAKNQPFIIARREVKATLAPPTFENPDRQTNPSPTKTSATLKRYATVDIKIFSTSYSARTPHSHSFLLWSRMLPPLYAAPAGSPQTERQRSAGFRVVLSLPLLCFPLCFALAPRRREVRRSLDSWFVPPFPLAYSALAPGRTEVQRSLDL